MMSHKFIMRENIGMDGMGFLGGLSSVFLQTVPKRRGMQREGQLIQQALVR